MLCALLTRAGFSCKTAADGLSAVTLIDEFSPQAAVVDVGLPGIDGLEVARRIRANPKHRNVTLIALLTVAGQRPTAPPRSRQASMRTW